MSEFLDSGLSIELRSQINKSNIFVYDQELCKHYNLICVVMDRLDSSINYLNRFQEPPKTEPELLIYFMYCCMIKDAIKELLANLSLENEFLDINNPTSYAYFREFCLKDPLNIPDAKCPIDDKFFEYLRSLAFAHPFKTERPKFFQKGEIQYSPWVIANSKQMSLRGYDDGIGIRIYTNKKTEIVDLILSFQSLQQFIKSRYLQLENATNKVKCIILEKELEWKMERIPPNLTYIEILEFIKAKLIERNVDFYPIEEALVYLKCDITDKKNQVNIAIFREAIIQTIPILINSFHELDYETLFVTLLNIINARPSKMHDMAGYQLEKIFSYLNDEAGTERNDWGLEQAKLFADEFAKKWVNINTSSMEYNEIKLLVATSCYLESENQLSKNL